MALPHFALAVGWRSPPDGQHFVEPRQRDDDASADADRTHGAITDGLVGGRAGYAKDLRCSGDGHRRRAVRAEVSELAEAHRWRGRRHEFVGNVVKRELAGGVGHTEGLVVDKRDATREIQKSVSGPDATDVSEVPQVPPNVSPFSCGSAATYVGSDLGPEGP